MFLEQEIEDQDLEDQEIESFEIDPQEIESQEIEYQEMEIPETETKVELKKIKPKLPFKPYRGKINFGDLNMLTETLSETEQRLEIARLRNESKLLRSISSRSATSRQKEEVDYEKKVIQKLFGTTIKVVNL